MAKKDAPKPEDAQAAEVVAQASMFEALHDYDAYVQAQAETIWQYDEIPVEGLSLEEKLFVRSYVVDRNPAATMRRLGHATDDVSKLKARAARYLRKPEVKEAIDWLAQRMMEKLDVTAEKVQRQMAAVAFFDPREVMTFDSHGVQLLHSRYWTPEQAAAIQSIKMGANGIEIKLYDRLKATEHLAKQIGLQPDDTNPAEAARAGAEAAVRKIFEVFDREQIDGPPPAALPGDDAKKLN